VAKVTSATATPTGTVTFVVDGQNQSPVPLDGNGNAVLTLSNLSAGQHTVTANYPGNTNFGPSSAPVPVTQTVMQAGSSTTASSTLNPSQFGQAVKFVATVTSSFATPDGNVTFTIDGQDQSAVPLSSGGQATLTV